MHCAGATPEQTFSRIVVPLDGSALAEQILPEVAALASRLNSTVSLLQVLTPLTYSQKEIMQPGLPWWDTDIAAADAYLARAASYLTGEGLTVSKDVVLSEDVATAILDYSARTRADLIALATSGVGGMSRLRVRDSCRRGNKEVAELAPRVSPEAPRRDCQRR